MKEETVNTFSILAKLSSVEENPEKSEAELAYEELITLANGQLAQLIEKSSYPHKSELKTDLEETLEQANLFLRYYFLYGKTLIGILGRGKSRADFLIGLSCGGYVEYARYQSIPCVVYHDAQAVNQVTAINMAGRAVALTRDEYALLRELNQKKTDGSAVHVNVGTAVRSYAISANLRHSAVDYVVMANPGSGLSAREGQLIGMCDAVFVFTGKGTVDLETTELMQSCRGPVYLLQGDDVEIPEDVLAQVRRSLPNHNVNQISMADAETVLEQSNRSRVNFFLYDQMLYTLLCLKQHQNDRIKECEENVSAFARDIVYDSQASDTLKELRQQEIEKLRQERERQKELETLTQMMQELTQKLEAAIKENVSPAWSEVLAESQTAYPQRYGESAFRIAVMALRSGDNLLAKKYMLRLQKIDPELAGVLQLYIYEAEKRLSYPLAAIEILRRNGADRPEVIHAKIHFAGRVGLSEDERNRLSYELEEKNAEETYYSALYMEKHGQDAIPCYRKALDAGSREAGNKLVSHYLRVGDMKNLKLLADHLFPEACHYYALDCLNNQHYATGIIYLKIAISQEYVPSISYYADMLFEEFQKSLKEEENVYEKYEWKIDTAIRLYGYLSAKGSGNIQNYTRQGILYWEKHDNKKALTCLKRAETDPLACYYLGKMYLYGHGVTKNLSTAETYLRKAQNAGVPGAAGEMSTLERKKKEAEEERAHKYNEDQIYSSSNISTSSVDDGCFITTATCSSMGKPDDCSELTAFRRYRDEVLLATDAGQALVKEYYRIAPGIVQKIGQTPEAEGIYNMLYDRYIAPGYQLLCEGKGDEARGLYTEAVVMLADRFGVELRETVAEAY